MVARANDEDGVHTCVVPTSCRRADGGAPSSDPMSYISLFLKNIVVTDPLDVSRAVATVAQ
jgi:hypothetical protein